MGPSSFLHSSVWSQVSLTFRGSRHEQTGHRRMSVWGESKGGRPGRTRSGRPDVEIRTYGAELSTVACTWAGRPTLQPRETMPPQGLGACCVTKYKLLLLSGSWFLQPGERSRQLLYVSLVLGALVSLSHYGVAPCQSPSWAE